MDHCRFDFFFRHAGTGSSSRTRLGSPKMDHCCTREQAVVHALGSAALVWTVARACRQGAVMECGCGALPTEPPNGRFQWGGCGDNILYAYSFNKEFFKPRKKSYQREKEESRDLGWQLAIIPAASTCKELLVDTERMNDGKKLAGEEKRSGEYPKN
ncbi:hypothetical protein HAZT_HAZT005173 [Hyalella azteca]|uniref:Protein Wnt n=1 Tax=Hyalella azteca TaxID=294128 RepID=A0A6A0HC89_HYAAZ|nr:hypothetical protein HAZT_HAZT005173 [Hyalella azteca]